MTCSTCKHWDSITGQSGVCLRLTNEDYDDVPDRRELVVLGMDVEVRTDARASCSMWEAE